MNSNSSFEKNIFPTTNFLPEPLASFPYQHTKEGVPVYNLIFDWLSSNEISVHFTEDKKLLNSV